MTRPAWVVLAEDVAALPAGASLGQRVAPLLRNLVLAAGTGQANLWLPEDPLPAGPAFAPEGGADAGPVRPGVRAGVRAVAAVRDGGQQVGALVLTDGEDGPAEEVSAELLAQTADCVALLLREVRADASQREQAVHAAGLARRAAKVEADLAAVLDVERHRLAGWVLTGTTRRLVEVTRRWRDFAAAAHDDPSRTLVTLRELRVAVDELIDDFRTVVRAVHPSTLRSRGTAAALRELAAGLPRQVSCTGDFGRRVGWEVESGIYHATAVVFAAVAATADTPLSVRFSRAADRLTVRVGDPAGSAQRLRAALADDARLLAALGGGLRCHASPTGAALVDVWLPQRLGGDDDPGPPCTTPPSP
ncbi:hypothetical protein [Frankia gtarii]|uniref:hypothetical protein n=1 Tax=Frankia gtarii TaxID=2950102 RepID=UPI0021BF8972|nr:hypothetical protein [Frankia gtarii]